MPSLDDLGSRQFVEAIPASDDLIPFFDVSESGNAALKKTRVSDIGGSVTAASIDTALAADTSQAASIRASLELNAAAVIVRKDGVRVPYLASANTDAARGVALTSAIKAVTNGQTLICAPGDFYMAEMNLLLVENVTYIWNGARLYINGSSAGRVGGEAALAIALFTSGFAVAPLNVAGWKFIGPLILDGASISGKRGMFPIGTSEALVTGVTFKNWASAGFNALSSTGRGNRMSDCSFTGNGTGAVWSSGEYWVVSNCHATSNATGFDIDAGNLYFANCTASFNTSYGVKISGASANEGHGSWVGGSINHHQSGAVGLYVDPALNLYGFSFTGVLSYSSTFDLNGIGIDWNGGQIRDCTFASSGTQLGAHTFRDVMFFQNTGSEATSLAGLTAAKRANIRFINGKTPDGALVSWNDEVDNAYVAKTANYTITGADGTVDVTANSPTITLPDAITRPGRKFTIANTGAGTVTLATTSSQTINGSAPGTVAAGARLTVQSTGTNWISL